MKKYSKELIQFVDSVSGLNCLAVIKNRNTKYYNSYIILKKETNFLLEDVSVKERIYYVKKGIHHIVQCPTCGKNTKVNHKTDSPKFCGVKCSKLYINPSTGISIASSASKKGAITKSENIINGQSQQNIINNKIKKSFDIIEGNGETKKKNLINKLSTIMNTCQESGLTLAQESGKKCSITKNTVNPISGLTNAQESGAKTKITLKLKSYNKIIKKLELFNCLLISSFDQWLNSTFIIYKCNKCNSVRQSYYSYVRCLECYPYNTSVGENEVLEFCQSLTNNIESNSRQIINPLELDIHLPEHNLAIEYDGLYWHSSDSVETESSDYHLYKTEQCASKNIQLFHIFENEWLDPQKQLIWKSIISNQLGKSSRIFARKTKVKSVSSDVTREFLNSNHLQGACVSSVNLGLYLDDSLVSLMTFGRSRYDKKVEWELLRFCNVLGTSVVGGASRLLKNFQRENEGSIISYADRRRSNGNLYSQLGFELSHESAPNYWYFKNNDKFNIFSRIKFQKHKLPELLEVYNSTLTESENMYNNGYRKIYDCGNQVWKLD